MSDTSYSGGSGSVATVTAFFDSREEAVRAVDRLSAIGLPEGTVTLTEGRSNELVTDTTEDKGFFESLADFFFPHDDRSAYAEGLSRGGFLVTASRIPADLYDTAVDVLDDEGAVDIDERSASWRSEGWEGVTAAQTGAQADILAGASMGTSTAEVEAGTSGMAGMDTPHSGAVEGADSVSGGESAWGAGTITPEDRRGDMWQRDMHRDRPRVRTYLAVPPDLDEDEYDDGDGSDATERNNLPS